MHDRELIKPVLAGIALALIVFCGAAGLAFLSLNSPINGSERKTAMFTIFRMPTVTTAATLDTGALVVGTGSVNPLQNNGIRIGAYVQITGTGGVGLKIRKDPGLEGTQQFIAMEDEIFTVIDGPIVEDGIQWWLLLASYDKNRQGWAAGQYLAVVE